jgi:mono/diheme cytochrome c family protein
VIAGCIALGSASAHAMTAQDQQAGWVAAARTTGAAFAPTAARGKALFEQLFTQSKEMPSCASCHTKDPRVAGKHVVTGKAITALSPVTNAERFTDAVKSEKWFKRNCNDVIGRECSAAEKADFVEYLLRGSK